jgi:hypothetical protein
MPCARLRLEEKSEMVKGMNMRRCAGSATRALSRADVEKKEGNALQESTWTRFHREPKIAAAQTLAR